MSLVLYAPAYAHTKHCRVNHYADKLASKERKKKISEDKFGREGGFKFWIFFYSISSPTSIKQVLPR